MPRSRPPAIAMHDDRGIVGEGRVVAARHGQREPELLLQPVAQHEGEQERRHLIAELAQKIAGAAPRWPSARYRTL